MISQTSRRVSGALSIVGLAALLGACAGSPGTDTVSVSEPVTPRRAEAQTPVSPPPATSLGERAVAVALAQVGAPYRYGGQTPGGFDCSGLVHYAYGQAGGAVPRTTGQLWTRAETVADTDLQAGDLLFFSIAGKMQHVGMYVGNGRFVHAPSSGKVVSVESLSSAYYRRALLRGGRLPQAAIR